MVWYRLAATGRSGHFAPITWFSLHPEKKCGPAPGAIDVTLPELGQIVTFTRSLQVDGGAARELKLSVETIARGNLPLAVMLVLSVVTIAGVVMRRRSEIGT